MPVKQRLAKERRHRLTPAAIEAFMAGDRRALYWALDLRPWMPSPLDVDGPEPPAWGRDGTAWAQSWPAIWRLRQELEAALKAAGGR